MTPTERVEAALRALGPAAEGRRADPWNAFLDVDAAGARARAQAIEAEGPRGRPLHGLVVSVKDNLAVAGRRMTCGSRHLERYVAPYTATAVRRLEDAGAILLGKTNLDEFAAGSSGENSAFGPTRNPRDPERVPGGSSSGAAASVAAGVADVALGSDTGGSVRCPGAFCGVAALRPTRGLVSRHGLADLAMSLETPAPLARDVATLAAALAAISGPDPRDPTARRTLGTLDLAHGARGLRVGVLREYFEGVEPATERAVREALARLENAGATLVEVSVPETRDSLAAYYLVNYVEFASAMQRFDGFRFGTPAAAEGALEEAVAAGRASFGPEVRRRILLGTYASEQEHAARWYTTAVAARGRLAASFRRALAQVDLLAGPTMPFRAFRLGEKTDDPLAMYAADVLTVTANLADLPAGTVPVRAQGLPVGLQLLGRGGEDARVLEAMAEVERLEVEA